MAKDVLEQQVLLYDSQKCSGCDYCMIVCSYHHFGVIDVEKAYLRVRQDKSKSAAFFNSHCTHCEFPVCEAACPTTPKAIIKDPEQGFVTIDQLRCIGCKSCNFACPISVPIFDDMAGVSSKCDFCDGDPLCVKYCSTGALQVVSRGEAKRIMEEVSHE